MKFIILAAALFTAVVATAADAVSPAKPLRQASVRGYIEKLTVTYEPLSFNTERVCDLNGTVPVYGPTQPNESRSVPRLASCTVSYDGGRASLDVAANIQVSAPNDRHGQAKEAQAILDVVIPGAPEKMVSTLGAAGNENLTARTLLLTIGTASHRQADPKKANENFTVFLTFDDAGS